MSRNHLPGLGGHYPRRVEATGCGQPHSHVGWSIFRFMALPLRIPMFSLDRDPIPRQFRNWCRPKRLAFSWFSPKENHTSRSLSAHSNCETALVPIPNRTPCRFRRQIPIPELRSTPFQPPRRSIDQSESLLLPLGNCYNRMNLLI